MSAERSAWQIVSRASIITDIIRMSKHLENDLVVANMTLMHRFSDDTVNTLKVPVIENWEVHVQLTVDVLRQV